LKSFYTAVVDALDLLAATRPGPDLVNAYRHILGGIASWIDLPLASPDPEDDLLGLGAEVRAAEQLADVGEACHRLSGLARTALSFKRD
jgi:hypothetical protein